VDVTLVTVTQPSRRHFLPEMMESVAAQTVLPAAHVLVWDHGDGFEATVNRGVGMVETDYYCLLDDDDLLLPDHVETLTGNLSADVVWTWTRVEGRDWNPNSGYVPGCFRSRTTSRRITRSGLTCFTSWAVTVRLRGGLTMTC
jgi:hypothetical protein